MQLKSQCGIHRSRDLRVPEKRPSDISHGDVIFCRGGSMAVQFSVYAAAAAAACVSAALRSAHLAERSGEFPRAACVFTVKLLKQNTITSRLILLVGRVVPTALRCAVLFARCSFHYVTTSPSSLPPPRRNAISAAACARRPCRWWTDVAVA
jgi:hypothetical protein